MEPFQKKLVALTAAVGVAVFGAACEADTTANEGDTTAERTEVDTEVDTGTDTDIDTGEDTSTDLGDETETAG